MSATKFKRNILSEDGTLNFDFMTSLQNIAIAKVVSDLWMNQNIQQEVMDLPRYCFRDWATKLREIWRKIENNVITEITQLPLPKFIRKMLIDIAPGVGSSLADWISSHERFLECSGVSEYSAVDLKANITWTARGKVDYTQTAKNILANADICLSDDFKYKLACTYSLENEIVALATKVVNQDYLNNVHICVFPMVYFWTTYITGEDTKLLNHFRNDRHSYMSINTYIFQLLIDHDSHFKEINKEAIKYMWYKLSEVEQAEVITTFVLLDLCTKDMKYTLLSNLSYEQQKKVFKSDSFAHIILPDILNDWLWRDYFVPVMLHILDIAPLDDYKFFSILEEIINKMIQNFEMENICTYNQYKNCFIDLWQKSSRPYIDSLPFSFADLLIKALTLLKDTNVVELIFNYLSGEQKKNIIFSYSTISFLALSIENDKWDLIEFLIKCALSSQEDVYELKRKLVEEKGYEIVGHLLREAASHKIDHFMSWAFKSGEEADEFKKQYAYTKCLAMLLNVHLVQNKIDFNELENHFKWCAKGDLEVVNHYKSEYPKFAKEFISKSIQEYRYHLLDLFLNWCFSGDQQKIVEFKCNMYKDDNLADFRSLVYILIENDKSFGLLDEFVCWCFSNEQEVWEFKTRMLYPPEVIFNICTKLLKEHSLELTEKFINWCSLSSEAVSKFKNAFVLSADMKCMIYVTCNYDSKCHLEKLIKWFNPSKTTVQKLKNLMSTLPCANLYDVLDKFIETFDE